MVQNIVQNSNGISVICNEYRNEANFFEIPLHSTSISIKDMSHFSDMYRHCKHPRS